MKTIAQLTVISLMLACLSTAWAAVPDLIPVQGYLSDKVSGDPIDGLTDMRFDIYSAKTGGTLLWESVYNSGTEQVDVDEGYFVVYLGELTAHPLDFYSLIGESQLWLQLAVEGEAMDRIRMASVAFSEQAQYCAQIGDMEAGDIQPSLGPPCEEGHYLRGWDADAGTPICDEDQTDFSGTGYLNISGSDLASEHPDQGLSITNWGAAFRSVNDGHTNATAPVHLPDGATVTKMTVWLLDNVDASSARMDVRLGRRSIALTPFVNSWTSSNPSVTWLASVATSDSTGASANIQIKEVNNINQTIDNYNYDYYLFVAIGVDGTARGENLVFFRARIEYTI